MLSLIKLLKKKIKTKLKQKRSIKDLKQPMGLGIDKRGKITPCCFDSAKIRFSISVKSLARIVNR